jgi:hypothetical protein
MIFGESAETTGIAGPDMQHELQSQMCSAWGLLLTPMADSKALGWPGYNPEGEHTDSIQMICPLTFLTLAKMGHSKHPSMSFVDTKDFAQQCAA